MLDKEGGGACSAPLGARLVGSIELHEQCPGGLWSMIVKHEGRSQPTILHAITRLVSAVTCAVLFVETSTSLLKECGPH